MSRIAQLCATVLSMLFLCSLLGDICMTVHGEGIISENGVEGIISENGVDCGPIGPRGRCLSPSTKARYVSLALNVASDPSKAAVPTNKTWCVASPVAYESVLKDILNKLCSTIDCKILQPGGPCYILNNIRSQASVAMNLFYVSSPDHKCDFQNNSIVIVSDPSFGSCHMPGKEE